ncbi:MAG TPA: T9SS type A sorting domain-containing protein, partial [Flavobacteriales bacterium]|nr:T9SS type A sorting domain-containing protein [Flavobacteriales bacterium]
LTVSVDGPGGNEQLETTSPATYDPGTENVIMSTTFIPSGTIGDYSITYTVDQNETDEIPVNNELVRGFQVAQNIYAHDDGVVQSFQTQGPDNTTDAFEVGNHFVLLQDGTVSAIQVAVHADTPIGVSIYGAIYTPPTTTTDPPALVDLSEDHTVTAADLNTVGGTTFVTIPFPNPVPLTATQPYLVVAGSFDGPDNVHFATSGVSEAQVSIIHYPNIAPPNDEFYITKTPMVRMVLGGGVGIQEMGGLSVSAANAPNPFSETTTISFALRNTENVTLTVTDVTGKQVMARNLGRCSAGQQRYQLDGRSLAEGVYTYTISTSHAHLTNRMVVTR